MMSRTPLTLLASAAVISLTALALASCGGDKETTDGRERAAQGRKR